MFIVVHVGFRGTMNTTINLVNGMRRMHGMYIQ